MAALMYSIVKMRIPKRRFCRISLFHINATKMKTHNGHCYSTALSAENESEFSEIAKYPECFDPSPLNRKRMKRQEWYDHIKNLPTVEQKLMEIGKNGPNFRVIMLRCFSPTYNPLPLTLYNTRTHLIEGMPDSYNTINVDKLAEYITPRIMQTLRESFDEEFCAVPNRKWSRAFLERRRGQVLTDAFYRIVTSLLSLEYPHLSNCQVNYNSRCDSFWWCGGFPPTAREKKFRKNFPKSFPPVEAPMDVLFQYVDQPYMQVCHEDPLSPFVHPEDPLCANSEPHECNYHPRASGYKRVTRYATSVPGFWPGEPCGFGTLSVYTREKLLRYVHCYGDDTLQTTLHNCGILSSFAWLTSLAYYKGFSPYHELTYPMMTQTIITNGQLWSFYAYQLNTICLSEDVDTKLKRNICWATPEMKLFDAIDDSGQVQGFNKDVLRHMIKFILNSPSTQDADIASRTPYLQQQQQQQPPPPPPGTSEQQVQEQQLKSDEEWAAIYKRFKNNYANRYVARHIKQLPRWEFIYKRIFQDKVMGKK